MVTRAAGFRRLLAPRHIAFVGGAAAAAGVSKCRAFGFEGEIWCVNPSASAPDGATGYGSVEALPAAPDAAYIAVRGELTVEVVGALAGRGAGGAICYAAGFAEMGGSGSLLQDRLVAAAGAEMALLGPNCYGLLNCVDGVAMWAGTPRVGRAGRGVALASQSGAVCETMTFGDRSLAFSYIVSVGNQAVIGIEEVVAAYVESEAVTAIGLYVEGLRDVAAFARAAIRALERGIPIIAVKAGQSEAGAAIALGHTSSLAGSDRLYDALFHRLGIIRVDSVPLLLETAKLISVAGVPASRRISVLACSGGDVAMAADHAARLGLVLPPLSPEQAAVIRAELPPFVNVTNPLDYTLAGWGRAELQRRVFTAMAMGEADTAMMVMEYVPAEDADHAFCNTAVDAMIAAHEASGKPTLVASHLPEDLPPEARARMLAAGVAPMQGFEDAMRALTHAAWYGERRRAALADGHAKPALALAAPAAVPGTPRLLPEWEAKECLARTGLRVPEGRVVTAAEAADAAAEMGFPVVVKAAGAPLAHKTEAGAVALGLGDGAAVRRAVEAIGRAAATDRFLVEPMVSGAVAELIVGVTFDALFGHALVIGAGGILVELIEDSRSLLLPTDRTAVAEALDALKVGHLIAGYRGRPPGDRAAAIDAVLAVAGFAAAHAERVREIDVNPLLVLPEGQGAVAVDALIAMVDGGG